jgi:hypothetical protein
VSRFDYRSLAETLVFQESEKLSKKLRDATPRELVESAARLRATAPGPRGLIRAATYAQIASERSPAAVAELHRCLDRLSIMLQEADELMGQVIPR